MRKGQILLVIVLSVLSSVSAVYLLNQNNRANLQSPVQNREEIPITQVDNQSRTQSFGTVDFKEASAKSTKSVVFIKTESRAQVRSSFWFFDFDPFGNIGKVASTGSGVIISPDGYIVTNHHVVKNAEKIEVVLNHQKRSYVAKIIGTAPSSDLALLKIEAKNLPEIEIGNSDELAIGEWVLAVGNPFNLTSTVTAGIVSAKGRNINIVNNRFPIESFIQTDAAINPGNSGGALVDREGKLVGINTAIASRTGSYVGYGFAIPSNLVVKIINDLKEFGQIQSGYDGLEIMDLDQASSEKYNTEEGVVVVGIGATNEKAGGLFKENDIILSIDDKPIPNVSAYKELIAQHRPGDALTYKLIRNGKDKEVVHRLVNKEGTYKLLRKQIFSSDKLGADLELISKLEKDLYGIKSGVKVSNIRRGELQKMGITDGFIFTSVNRKPISGIDQLMKELSNTKGRLLIQGINENGQPRTMSFYVY